MFFTSNKQLKRLNSLNNDNLIKKIKIENKHNKSGWVYFCTNNNLLKENVYKLGQTKYLYEHFQFLNSSQYGDDNKFKIFLKFFVSDCVYVEEILKTWITSKKVENNFYKLNMDDISEIVHKIENKDDFEKYFDVLKLEYEKDYFVHIKKNHDEYEYLNLVEKIIKKGVVRSDRTGVGTISIFGAQMRFNLKNNSFPLLTTKKIFYRAIFEELLWFITGSTNAKDLQNKNIHIWDGNSSREFLDKNGFHDRQDGDLGPIYGFQWRHYGAKYKTCYDDYTGQGIDQLYKVIEQIKNNPNDRRIIMSAWNVIDIPKMVLPPCHCFVQFYVSNGKLSCQLYQRSADMGLGVPFNIASYALLTFMIASITGLNPGEFIHTIGDAHIYLNHVEQLKYQIQLEPKPFPLLKFRRTFNCIEDIKYNDIEIIGYDSHPSIKLEMAI